MKSYQIDQPTHIFYGHVLPERANVLSHPRPLHFLSEIGRVDCVVEIVQSKITVRTVIRGFWDLVDLRWQIKEAVDTLVSVIGFRNGCAYEANIEAVYSYADCRVQDFGVQSMIFDPQQTGKQDHVPPFENAPAEPKFIKALNRHPELKIALKDFRVALSDANFTAFYCYRAIEALRNTFQGEAQEQWASLWKTVGFDRNYISSIEKPAGEMRHGKFVLQTWEIRKIQLERCWSVIAAYVEWGYLQPSTPRSSPAATGNSHW